MRSTFSLVVCWRFYFYFVDRPNMSRNMPLEASLRNVCFWSDIGYWWAKQSTEIKWLIQASQNMGSSFSVAFKMYRVRGDYRGALKTEAEMVRRLLWSKSKKSRWLTVGSQHCVNTGLLLHTMPLLHWILVFFGKFSDLFFSQETMNRCRLFQRLTYWNHEDYDDA